MRIFRSEIELPVYLSTVRKMGILDEYNNITSDEEALPPPKGVPDIIIKARLVSPFAFLLLFYTSAKKGGAKSR